MWEFCSRVVNVNPNPVKLIAVNLFPFRLSRFPGHELQIFLFRTYLLCGIHAGPWGPLS